MTDAETAASPAEVEMMLAFDGEAICPAAVIYLGEAIESALK